LLHHQCSVWWPEGRSPGDRRKRGIKRSTMVDAEGIPLGVVAAPANRQARCFWVKPWMLLRRLRRVARACERPPRSCLRLEPHQRASPWPWLGGRDLQEGQTSSPASYKTVGGGTNQLLEQCPQEAGVVHRERRASHRLLDRFLERNHHRGEAHSESLETLPLAIPTSPSTMTHCWRKLLLKNTAYG
jgi:hypothetical protein